MRSKIGEGKKVRLAFLCDGISGKGKEGLFWTFSKGEDYADSSITPLVVKIDMNYPLKKAAEELRDLADSLD